MIPNPGGAPRSEDRAAFVDWLKAETLSALKAAAGNAEALREVVLFYLRIAYRARLKPEMTCDLFGDSPESVLRQANLSEVDENTAMDHFEELDPIIAAQYGDTQECSGA